MYITRLLNPKGQVLEEKCHKYKEDVICYILEQMKDNCREHNEPECKPCQQNKPVPELLLNDVEVYEVDYGLKKLYPLYVVFNGLKMELSYKKPTQTTTNIVNILV